jgi:death on curing protein
MLVLSGECVPALPSRSPGTKEAALARPVNKWHYGEDGAAALATAYAYELARNHPCADGNKRSAWVAARLSLALKGSSCASLRRDAIAAMMTLAPSDLSEEELADWFRQRVH